MTIDERELAELTQRSRDVHSDAMRASREPLAEIVEVGHERRSNGRGRSRRRARVRGEAQRAPRQGTRSARRCRHRRRAPRALRAARRSPTRTSDIQMLQTAASIEVLAVAAYEAVLGLPFAGDLPAVVQTFVTTTKDQHSEHLQAFNSAAKALGGKEQTMADPVLAPMVEQAKPGLTGPGPVLDLAILLENTAAETYVAERRCARGREREEGHGEHHGRRGPARLGAARGAGAARRRAGRPDRAAACRPERAARRSRERRLPRTPSTRPTWPALRTKELCNDPARRDHDRSRSRSASASSRR